MAVTLAYDVYGTLINTDGVKQTIEQTVPQRADEFSRIWRQKQLEYSFRRGLMQNYVDFSICTRQALEYTVQKLGIRISDDKRAELLEAYTTLPAFEEIPESLKEARKHGFQIYAFSNGSREAVKQLLDHNEIASLFDGIVSASAICSFKPNPGVYAHFIRRSGTTSDECWMISGNPFDVLGAKSAGMRAAWIQRSENKIMDPWELQPDLIMESLAGLAQQIVFEQ